MNYLQEFVSNTTMPNVKIKMQSAFFNDCFPIWNHCLSLALHIVCQGREAYTFG